MMHDIQVLSGFTDGGIPMKKNEYLNAYLNSWVGCDKDQLIKSLAESYEMDDPAAGHIPKPDMPGYMDSFKLAHAPPVGGEIIARASDQIGSRRPRASKRCPMVAQ